MIVADTNIMAYLALPSPYTDLAIRLLRKSPEWAAPMLWRSEFRNVLALHMRKGLLTLPQALALQQQMEERMAGREFTPSSAKVLRLVEESACSAYDCEFVALAEELETHLITLDKKLLRSFPDKCVSLHDAVQ